MVNSSFQGGVEAGAASPQAGQESIQAGETTLGLAGRAREIGSFRR